ncbi:protein of unknown function [Candidatus Hydrogenisulfobacillus filiaventi]|uniref:Uncharacterized protein n=1 Tax=Candidatus Hydrogenisulfobacillus filiaventi TaxID=2707344 RepID=A0A6F8ZIG0_9FIRM|nr:protein of unknown function [Candidatus Hydrogenisulfobacillus filiaventi]CAB1129444.1 protein of unknown function [Candidatus Hydrogenisulfobacillus filiaventi]
MSSSSASQRTASPSSQIRHSARSSGLAAARTGKALSGKRSSPPLVRSNAIQSSTNRTPVTFGRRGRTRSRRTGRIRKTDISRTPPSLLRPHLGLFRFPFAGYLFITSLRKAQSLSHFVGPHTRSNYHDRHFWQPYFDQPISVCYMNMHFLKQVFTPKKEAERPFHEDRGQGHHPLSLYIVPAPCSTHTA